MAKNFNRGLPTGWSADEEQFFKRLNLRDIAERDFGFKEDEKSSTPKNRTFKGNGVTLNINPDADGRYLYRYPGQPGQGGSIVDFYKEFGKGIFSVREAFAAVREYAKQYHAAEYEALRSQYFKNSASASNQQQNNLKQTPVQDAAPTSEPAIEQPEEELSQAGKQKPAALTILSTNNFDFLLDRGISPDLLEHPHFKRRLLSSDAFFGGVSEEKKAVVKMAELEFGHHLVIPLYDLEGNIIQVEYKNRMKESVYQKKVEKAVEKGEKVSDIRRNPSRYGQGSSGSAIWYSNPPEKPDRIVLAEQTIDAISYFQLNQEQLRNAIIIATSGNATPAKLSSVLALAKRYDINRFEGAFDNDIAGLKFTLFFLERIKEKDSPWVLTPNDILRDQLILTVGLEKPIDSKNPNPTAQASKLQQDVYDAFQLEDFDGPVGKLPAHETGSHLTRLIIPYSSKNAQLLVAGCMRLHKIAPDRFTLKQPAAKDWNDVLKGKPAEKYSRSVFLMDHAANRNRILVDENLNIIAQRRVFSVDQNVRERIGVIKPFDFRPIQTADRLMLPDELVHPFRKFQADYNQLVPTFTGKIVREHFVNGFRAIEQGKITSAQQKQIDLFTQLRELNQATGAPASDFSLRMENGHVYFGRERNHGLKYYPQDRSFKLYRKVGELQADQVAWTIPLDDAEKEAVRSVMKDRTLVGGEFFINEKDEVVQGKKVGQFSNNRIDLDSTFDFTEDQMQVLERMQVDLLAGKDPNHPGLLGHITPHFTFTFAKGVKPIELSDVKKLELAVLFDLLETYRAGYQKLRELYPEPTQLIKSENSIFYYGNIPHYKYDRASNTISYLGKPQDLIGRSFPPYYYQALTEFTNNKGVFHNYMRLMKIDLNTLAVYYKQPDFIVGKAFKSKDGEYLIALRDNLPDALRSEMKAMSTLRIATADEVKEHGVSLDFTNSARVKDKRTSVIPPELQMFFTANGKLKPLSDSVLATHSPAYREAYQSALLYHLDASKNLGAPKDFKVYHKEGKVFFNNLHVETLDNTTGKLVTVIPVSPQFYPQLALIEQQIVINPANRRYQQYLTSEAVGDVLDEQQKQDVKNLLSRIDLDTQTGRLLIRDSSSHKVHTFAHEENGRLIIDQNYQSVSATFQQAMKFYAEQRKLDISWEPNLQAQFDNKTQINAPEILPRESYNHELLVNSDGILRGILSVGNLKHQVSEVGGRTMIHFTSSGKGPLSVPFTEDYSKITEPLAWMYSPKQVDTIILAQTPQLALQAHQLCWLTPLHENAPAGIHGRELLASYLNTPIPKIREHIEKLVSVYNCNRITLAGNTDFVKTFKDAFGNSTKFSVKSAEMAPLDKSHQIIKDSIRFVKPDKFLDMAAKEAVDNMRGHRLFRVAPGVVIIPTDSNAATHRMAIGENREFHQVHNGIWFSRDPREWKGMKNPRVIMVKDPREAIFYMSINKDFLQDDIVVSFQGKVTKDSINHLTNLLASPRYDGKIRAVSSDRFAGVLQDAGFRYDYKLENPHALYTSFEQEYVASIKAEDSIKKQLREKTKSPTLVKTQAPEHIRSHIQEPVTTNLEK